MTIFTQEPGELHITATRGDDFEFTLTFEGINFSGYTFSANVEVISTNNLVPITVTATDPTNGVIKLSLAKATLNELALAKHHWYLTWTIGGKSRRILAGKFEVIEYPK